ncbi:SxtJ family membrane protein [Chitinophaga sp. RAB17]|uniref:SxtJ family membrane protein n=1 Tax=Chitinophaga sp. RAB17 TaxID=3233049 RepID=UPI003F9350C0
MQKNSAVITRQQCIEFGQVVVLAAIVAALYYRNFQLVALALGALTITILVPQLFHPLAWIWFGFSKILGEINIRVLLTLVFVLVVLPVGLWRKLRGRDSLLLRRFKKDDASVMVVRNHLYTKEDLQHTF